MKVTHLGHSCLLLQYDDARILVDPGNLSWGFEDLTDLDAIMVTHQHPDHLDPERVPALVRANPGASLIVEPEVAARLRGSDDSSLGSLEPRVLAAGGHVTIGSVLVEADGGKHAIIHQDLPRVGNVGLLLRAEGEPTLFHPGDSLEAIPTGVEVLAVPVSAPWCAAKETIEFVRAVKAPRAIPIHDQVVSPKGRPIYLQHIANLGGSEVLDLADRGATEL